MTISSKPGSGADGTFRNGLDSGAGPLTGGRRADRGEQSIPGTPATEEWVNEGGSLALPDTDITAAVGSTAGSGRSRRTSSDTPEWCRERAAADLVSAGAMDTENGKLRFEHSAATWVMRADLMQRLNDSFDRRNAAAVAMRAKGEAPSIP